MPGRIEDYAVIGNCETVALVGRDGSIDWLGLPQFDSPACFAALLGEPKHGRWLIAPADGFASVSRRYSDDTLILETVFRTGSGAVRVTDFMVRRDRVADLVRIVTSLEGEVAMRMELIVRFDYGSVVPWVSIQDDGRLQLIAGPDRLLLETTVPTRGEDHRTVADFTVRAGEEKSFSLAWSPSFSELPRAAPVAETLRNVRAQWSDWARTFDAQHEWRDAVLRSLLTLKSLAHWETGGIVAAGTTSLPERIGGERNWDYRYCWLRDSTFTLLALIGSAYLDEAKAWHQWLLRAVAGSPDDVQTMYASRAKDASTNLSSRGCPVTGVQARSGSETLRSSSSNSMSTARCWTPFMRQGALGSRPRRKAGILNAPWSNIWKTSGAIPTTAFGKCAARDDISHTRR